MRNKKTVGLSVFMILIMIGIAILPAMASTATPDDFTVTITSSQNTALLTTDTGFTETLAGNTVEIADSFNLTNSGNVDCTVTATFTTFNTSLNTDNGLNGSTSYIPATSFSLNNTEGAAPKWVSLSIIAGVSMTTDNDVIADNAPDTWSAKIIVPAGQTAEVYTGTVELTFAGT